LTASPNPKAEPAFARSVAEKVPWITDGNAKLFTSDTDLDTKLITEALQYDLIAPLSCHEAFRSSSRKDH
jgi:hypothetical protein